MWSERVGGALTIGGLLVIGAEALLGQPDRSLSPIVIPDISFDFAPSPWR